MHPMARLPGSRSLWLLGPRLTSLSLFMGLLLVLVMRSLVCGEFSASNPEAPPLPEFPKRLRCYRCLLETKALGCLLGPDTCVAPQGSSCITVHVKNSNNIDFMVSDCRRQDHASDCLRTRSWAVSGFSVYSRCCFEDLCNDPLSRATYSQ
ncbi:lymphocyte antigen 6 complex locus protein G5c [Tenrec ecaudatus]|uniref:lymphocyte antigen 6 complex locus protein G5c n=1 Tax=Tenrec ecaudatus TaxID=94439 RepID=UPI003F598145